jgi:Holliday junction DNA helicase RuvA
VISYVDGKLVEKAPTSAVIDVNGVGYGVSIPVSTYEVLGPLGSSTRLFTYLSVKDDRMELFGFSTPDERRLFLMLISVSGIGGRTAISILSGAKPDELKGAIASGDQRFISSIRGIGKKTAERLIVDLKDKFVEEESKVGKRIGPFDDAITALRSLGLKIPEAEQALNRVLKEKGKDIPVEEMVREALKRFS